MLPLVTESRTAITRRPPVSPSLDLRQRRGSVEAPSIRCTRFAIGWRSIESGCADGCRYRLRSPCPLPINFDSDAITVPTATGQPRFSMMMSGLGGPDHLLCRITSAGSWMIGTPSPTPQVESSRTCPPACSASTAVSNTRRSRPSASDMARTCCAKRAIVGTTHVTDLRFASSATVMHRRRPKRQRPGPKTGSTFPGNAPRSGGSSALPWDHVATAALRRRARTVGSPCPAEHGLRGCAIRYSFPLQPARLSE